MVNSPGWSIVLLSNFRNKTRGHKNFQGIFCFLGEEPLFRYVFQFNTERRISYSNKDQ